MSATSILLLLAAAGAAGAWVFQEIADADPSNSLPIIGMILCWVSAGFCVVVAGILASISFWDL